jgi:hypothetical protein
MLRWGSIILASFETVRIDRVVVGRQAGKTRCILGMQNFAALMQQAERGA